MLIARATSVHLVFRHRWINLALIRIPDTDILAMSGGSSTATCMHACGTVTPARVMSRPYDLNNQVLRIASREGTSACDPYDNFYAEPVFYPTAAASDR